MGSAFRADATGARSHTNRKEIFGQLVLASVCNILQ